MIGTMILVLFGCGVAAVTAYAGMDNAGRVVAIALAFGLSIVAGAYFIGNVSGCHVNPAVSLGMFIDGRLSKKDLVFYIIFQFIGAIIGAALLYAIVSSCGLVDTVFTLGQNGYDNESMLHISMLGAFLVEVILTFVFVCTVLGVTSSEKTSAQAGIVIGLTLTFVHLLGICLTGTSVNPARSFGPALLMLTTTSVPMEQVWLFIVAPLVGALIAGFVWKYFRPAKNAQ
jgi:aquaporin Z